MNLLCCLQDQNFVFLSVCIFFSTLVICSCIEQIFSDKNKTILELKKIEYEHEKEMKELSSKRDKNIIESERNRKEDDLSRKIKEFEELTIREKLLDKVIEKEISNEVSELKNSIDKIKDDLSKAKLDFSGYILKKYEK